MIHHIPNGLLLSDESKTRQSLWRVNIPEGFRELASIGQQMNDRYTHSRDAPVYRLTKWVEKRIADVFGSAVKLIDVSNASIVSTASTAELFLHMQGWEKVVRFSRSIRTTDYAPELQEIDPEALFMEQDYHIVAFFRNEESALMTQIRYPQHLIDNSRINMPDMMTAFRASCLLTQQHLEKHGLTPVVGL